MKGITGKGKLIFPIVLVQLIIISYLGIKIYQKKDKVLGTEVVAPIKKEDVIINSESTLTSFYEPQPNTIDKQNEWMPYEAIYTINSDALNERYDYTPEKPERTYRIITLGDSYTFGLYVNTEKNYSEVLEDSLNKEDFSCEKYDKFEVINLGYSGYDVQYSSERYRLRGEKYHPDLIVWLIKDDDMVQLNEEMMPQERIIAEELKRSGEFNQLVKKGNYYPSYRIASNLVIEKYGREQLADAQIYFLEEFRKLYDTPLLIVTFPNTNSLYRTKLKQFTEAHSNTYYYEELAAIDEVEDAVIPNDGHPSVLGHDMIAESLFEYLTKEKYISCN